MSNTIGDTIGDDFGAMRENSHPDEDGIKNDKNTSHTGDGNDNEFTTISDSNTAVLSAMNGVVAMDASGETESENDDNLIDHGEKNEIENDHQSPISHEHVTEENDAVPESMNENPTKDENGADGHNSTDHASFESVVTTMEDNQVQANNNDSDGKNSATSITVQPQQPPLHEESAKNSDIGNTAENPTSLEVDPSFQQYAMELNVALEALESMRQVNLEVEFSTAASSLPASIPSSAASFMSTVHHDQCTYCQREKVNKCIANPELLFKDKKNGNNTIGNAPEGRNERGGIKFDGSRIRRFRSRLFSKPAASLSQSDVDGTSAVASSEATESCPPRLGSPQSFSSSTDISDDGSESTNTMHPNSNPRKKTVLPRKKAIPCLTCGHPTCPTHSSSTFSTRHIPICQPCAYLFELDFLVDVITTTAANSSNNNTDECCRQKVNDMIDCYDRAKLLLIYTSQYTDEIAQSLETRTARSNKIGAGSSATGIVSGLAGVVGCGALLFPPVAAVGVPLLIASLVFGGTATAAQTGDAAVQYFSEPDRLADKIVALHGMVLSLLRITEVLSYGLLKDHLNGDDNGEGDNGSVSSSSSQREAFAKEIQELLAKHGVNTTVGMGALKSAVVGGAVAAEVATAAEMSAISSSTIASTASVVGRNSRYFGRVGTTAMSSARFVPVAGGLLSAACMVVEGKELKKTLSRISEGNLSDKAEQIRTIREELSRLPDSSLIAGECRHVFELAEKRRLKKAVLVNNSKNEKQNHEVGGLTLENVEDGDISDLITSMENAVATEADRDISRLVETMEHATAEPPY